MSDQTVQRYRALDVAPLRSGQPDRPINKTRPLPYR